MQRPSESKRRDIMCVAARLFAARPFQDVRLDEIAAAAHVGKGTLYIYFESKEALYVALIREGFSQVVADVKHQLAAVGLSWREQIRVVIRSLVGFAYRFPDLFQAMRQGIVPAGDAALLQLRAELAELLAAAIRRGVSEGQAADPYPELTAQYLMSAVRAARLHGPRDLPEHVMAEHMMSLLERGIVRGAPR